MGGSGGEAGGGPVHGSTEYDPEWSCVWKVPPVVEIVTGRTCGYGYVMSRGPGVSKSHSTESQWPVPMYVPMTVCVPTVHVRLPPTGTMPLPYTMTSGACSHTLVC